MKILYICGTYCPSFGGAEISAHTVLKQISSRPENTVLVITSSSKSYEKNALYDGIELYRAKHEERQGEISYVIENFKPDVVLTQLLWSDVALELANKHNIPSVLRVCKTPFYTDISINSALAPTTIITVSDSVKDYVRANWGRYSKVIHPPIDLGNIVSGIVIPEKNKYVTMFNPLVRKGGKIFCEIAKAMPTHDFAVVMGWNTLKTEKGEFDNSIIEHLCESLRIKYSGQKLESIDVFPKNVVILEPSEDVKTIYSQTRVLCVPSIWEEAFGRVALEGFANAIPVIGSNVGGLKEQVNKGGILVKDYQNPQEWVNILKELDDPEVYKYFSEKGKNYVDNNYDFNSIIQQYIAVFLNAIHAKT